MAVGQVRAADQGRGASEAVSPAPRDAARNVATAPPMAALAALAGATLVSACGGGGDTMPDAGRQPPADPQATALRPEESAVRFLNQAALGATTSEAVSLMNSGLDFSAWLNAQFAMPARSANGVDLNSRTAAQLAADLNIHDASQNPPRYIGSDYGLDNVLWFRLFTAPDVLRQRIVLALSEIFVVSVRNMPIPWGQFACLSYWDVLERHAFGTFRALLEAITLSPAMGVYLSLRGSQKSDGVGRRPDENFAREVLQLFTIGLVKLDSSGRVVGGDTYTQQDVTELARVFTGWDVDAAVPPDYTASTTPVYTTKPMVLNAALHDDGAKTLSFLSLNLPAGLGGQEDLKRTLDALCAHPNVAPFFARQLIQRLVSSNPEPDHVRRVAQVFTQTGGDLKAVIRAVLLDPLARDVLSGNAAVQRCKLREPVLRFVHWGRLARLRSTDNRWEIGDLSGNDRLGQGPLRSPSVFNFFRPGYVPLNSGVSADGFVAPEFQITNESTVIGYANFMLVNLAGQPGQGLVVDYSEWLPLADDPVALVDRVVLMLSGRAMASVSVGVIVDAVGKLPTGTVAARGNRVMMAWFLALTSPDYLVQR